MISSAPGHGDTVSGAPAARVHLRLFIARGSPYSVRAEAAVRGVCATFPEGRVELEVLDVVADPRSSLQYNVFVTPTLVRVEPKPVLRTTGPFESEALLRDVFGPPLPTSSPVKQ